MMRNRPRITPWETPRGTLTIHSFCPPETIAGLEFSASMKPYARYRPLVPGKENLMAAASWEDNNVTVVYTPHKRIVGLAILEYPSREERWTRVGHNVMMEVAAVEVAFEQRSSGLGTAILRELLDHPLKEERIFYMVGFSWTWDLEGTGLSPIRYRDVLIRLFSGFGFRTYQTNEPNVMLRPENLFMARIGENIPERVEKRFKWVRFDMDRQMERIAANETPRSSF